MKKKYGIAVAALVILSGCFQMPDASTNVNTTGSVGNVIDEVQDDREEEAQVRGKTLDLSNRGLTSISTSIFNDTSIEILDLSGNSLTGALPSEIGKLKNLRILRAADNQMTGVPAEVGHLLNLEVIDFSNNQLTGLPHELGNLKKLQTLDLRGNSPSEFDLNIIRQGIPQAEILL